MFRAFAPAVAFVIAAASSQPETWLQDRPPAHVILNEKIILSPRASYHFSMQAPQALGDFIPLLKTPQKIIWQPTEQGPYQLRVNICNDAETVCKQEDYSITVGEAHAFSKPPVTNRRSYERGQIVDGWILDDPDAALKLAEKTNKLLLIDFSGEWCPPCNSLDEFVLRSDEFKKASEGVVRVRLDIDKPTAEEWQRHFKVYRYPHLVLANTRLEEIAIHHDYNFEEPEVFIHWLREGITHRAEPLRVLERKLTNSKENIQEDEVVRVVRWRMTRGEYDSALNDLHGADQARHPKLDEMRAVSIWKKSELDADPRTEKESLNYLIAHFPGSIDFSEWVLALSDLDSKAVSVSQLEHALQSVEKWRTASEETLTKEEASKPYLTKEKAKLLAKLGRAAEAKATFKEAADEFAEFSRRSTLKTPRGPNMERAICLIDAEDYADARDLLSKMVEDYGSEHTFNFRYAKVLYQLKDYPRALEFVDRSIESSYGSSLYYAVALKAEILNAMGDRAKAQEIVHRALAEIKLPKDPNNDLQYALESLREVEKKVSSK